MYTLVPPPAVVEHRPRPGEPALEIIDHREQQPQGLRGKKKRPEQMPYDTLKNQRDDMFKKELKYKKRIEELEKDSAELLKTYENTYEENTKLKRILDNGPDASKLKQLSKDKKEQKGIIDHLKDENQSLAEKLAELEKEVQRERLKSNERSWDVELKKVRKKRAEEDAIPTEGPFVGGQIAKHKRMLLLEDNGHREEHDAYDLQVDSLEKETQVLLNKVKILKREKEQIDFANLMGKGAVTKNKTIATAINNKLNRDLNKFVIRLQMLKMKQNAARTFCTLMTDEANPLIQLKPSDMISGQASPEGSNTVSRSRISWKKSLPEAPTPKVTNGSNATIVTSNNQKADKTNHGKSSSRLSNSKETGTMKKNRQDNIKAKGPESILTKGSENSMTLGPDLPTKAKVNNSKNTRKRGQEHIKTKGPESIQTKGSEKSMTEVPDLPSKARKNSVSNQSRENSGKGSRNVVNKNKNGHPKMQAITQNPPSNKHNKTTSQEEQNGQRGENRSADIWEKVQSSKLFGGIKAKDINTDNSNHNKRQINLKSARTTTSKRDVKDSTTKQINNTTTQPKEGAVFSMRNRKDDPNPSSKDGVNNTKQRPIISSKQDTDSSGRYTHGPEPIGRKDLGEKKSVINGKELAPANAESVVPRKPKILQKNGLMGSHEDLTNHNHGHGHMYRINGPDDGFSLIRLHDHVDKTERGMRTKPVPIPFKNKKSFDVKEHRSVIGNSGIRKDAFYKLLDDGDPYFGL